VTRNEAELVRYVRASLTEEGDIFSLQACGGQVRGTATARTYALASQLTEHQPAQLAPSSPIQGEVVEEQADLMDDGVNEDDGDWDPQMVLEVPKNKVCRLCGQQARNMIAIFGTDGLDMLLAEKINSILPIHVT
jgi:hypothetical protein